MIEVAAFRGDGAARAFPGAALERAVIDVERGEELAFDAPLVRGRLYDFVLRGKVKVNVVPQSTRE